MLIAHHEGVVRQAMAGPSLAKGGHGGLGVTVHGVNRAWSGAGRERDRRVAQLTQIIQSLHVIMRLYIQNKSPGRIEV